MLKAENLTCVRSNQCLFSQLSFSLNPGEILHVVGSNGSGKSSLLQMLVGMLQPQYGCVYWQGKSLSDPAAVYYEDLLYLGHKVGVKNCLTVRENLGLMAQISGAGPIIDWSTLLPRFGLQALGHVLCGKLSAGQRQRVALTRLLLTPPAKIWVLDEPFTAIDSQTAIILQNLFAQFVAAGGMIVFTSHQPLSLLSEKVHQLKLSGGLS